MNPLLQACRLVWISDGRGDVARIERIVTAAVAGGLRAVQLREPDLPARELWRLCERLRRRLESVGGVLIVNDRIDLAAAAVCDGVHLGRRSMPWDAARAILPETALLGCSAHDEDELDDACAAGADYASLSPVFATVCKPGVQALGVEAAELWTQRCEIPVLWLGGIEKDALCDVSAAAFGFAVMSAIASAHDVAATTTTLCELILRAGSRSLP